jgi:hypothetical protein
VHFYRSNGVLEYWDVEDTILVHGFVCNTPILHHSNTPWNFTAGKVFALKAGPRVKAR